MANFFEQHFKITKRRLLDLFLATEDFKIKGVVYSGFPLLVNKDMELVKEVFDFLVKQCITRGRVQSPKSWKAYGQSLYDYFSFLEVNDWQWKDVGCSTILATYRDWSLGQVGLSPSTVNYRLRILVKFYQYALRRGWINSLPYSIEEIYIRK
jgi:integrase/recombinase XerD